MRRAFASSSSKNFGSLITGDEILGKSRKSKMKFVIDHMILHLLEFNCILTLSWDAMMIEKMAIFVCCDIIARNIVCIVILA